MSKGGYIITFEPERAYSFQLLAKQGEEFSLELSDLDWHPGQRELFFIEFDPGSKQINAAAMITRKKGPRNTNAHNYRFSNFVFFKAINISAIVNKLPASLKNNVKITSGGVGRKITHKTWENFLSILVEKRPEKGKDLKSLWKMVNSRSDAQSYKNTTNLGMQRDAVGLCLDCSAMSSKRRKVLRGAIESEEGMSETNFIHYLQSHENQERHIIEHDTRMMTALLSQGGDWAAEYFNEGDRSLRVVVVDKSKLEHGLGIDLIFYNEDYRSLVCVQYKCMKEEGVTWRFRPDNQFWMQLKKMTNAEEEINKILPETEDVPRDYRMNRNPFYFKFCKRIISSPSEGELTPGMFLSRLHTEHFLGTHLAKGRSGGVAIGYDNCQRYFNNSLFSALLREGWIGTRGLSDDQLVEVIDAACKSGRSIVFGQTWKANPMKS